MRWRSAALAGAGLIGLVLGLWLLDWWSLRTPSGEVHANLRRIEACTAVKCQQWSNAGPLSIAVLVGGSVLGAVTAAIGALQLAGAQLGPRFVRLQIGLALLVLAGVGVMFAMAPDHLGGVRIAPGLWVTLVAVI